MLSRAPMAVALLVALAALGVKADGSSTAAHPPDDSEGARRPHQTVPCDPTVSRVLDPLVVEEGAAVDVAVEFDYACPESKRQVAFYLVVENSAAIDPPSRFGEDLLDNVREGLTTFVEHMDYSAGSMGGMILYAGSPSEHIALQGGDGGQRALTNAVGSFPVSGNSAGGAAAAVEMATLGLAEADVGDGAWHFVLLVDAGAELGAAEEVFAACTAAADEGIHVALLALEEAGARLQDCASPEFYRESGRGRGQDVPEKLDTLGDGIARGKQADIVLLNDTLSLDAEYVEGSGQPEPSSSFLGELIWEFTPPAPDGGRSVAYQVKPEVIDATLKLSDAVSLTLEYADGTFGEVALPNPEVCVHRFGRPADCAAFALTLTPPVPTSTPTMTTQATDRPPTATPTPTAGTPVLLPATMNDAPL